jgi:hypothetical protein
MASASTVAGEHKRAGVDRAGARSRFQKFSFELRIIRECERLHKKVLQILPR